MVSCRSRGFTYLTVLFIVAVLMGGLALVGEVWETWAKREKEADLLFVGNQYRKAIQRYVLSGKAQYPRTLDDLLLDPRQPSKQRYLRKLYPDPMTGKMTPMKEKLTIVDDDHHTFEMWMPGPDGKLFRMMEITYARKK